MIFNIITKKNACCEFWKNAPMMSKREPNHGDKMEKWGVWIYEMKEPEEYAYPYIKVFVQISNDKDKPNWRNYEFPGHIMGHECPKYWINKKNGKIIKDGELVSICELDQWEEIK